jgi:hypothetical protein
MRRVLKDAVYAEGEYGGPLSKPHAVVKSGARNGAVQLSKLRFFASLL